MMLTRRRVLESSALLAQGRLLTSAAAQTQTPLRLAIIGNTYHYGSDLQIIADRLLVGYQHEGRWDTTTVKVVSLYVESKAHAPSDLSAARSKEFGFRVFRNIPEALRCGGDQLAIDAV